MKLLLRDPRAARRRERRAKLRRLSLGLTALALIGNTAPGGWAGKTELDGLGAEKVGLASARLVSDEELGEMRGKFVAPDSVTHFGITLHTLWQTADGVITAAKMALNVAFSGGQAGTPQITIGWVRDGDPTMDVTSFADNGGNGYVTYSADGLPGLNSVRGAVQSNVIAGTDNRVSNAMAVQIVPATSLPALGLGDSISSTRTDIAPDGDMLKFVVSAGQLGMIVQDAQGAGVVRQMIAENPGQLSQNVFLGGTANIVENVMNVTIGIDQLQGINDTQLINSLSAMKGHGF